MSAAAPASLAGARATAAALTSGIAALKLPLRTDVLAATAIVSNSSQKPTNVRRVESIVSESTWTDQFFPISNPEYTYINFLKSVAFFPGFCDSYPEPLDSDAVCRLLLATMFAHFVQETGAHDSLSSIPQWQQGLKYVREYGCSEENTDPRCLYNQDCGNPVFGFVKTSCGTGPNNSWNSYFGRGAHQLSYPYNYAPLSYTIYNNSSVLLDDPALVADTWLNLASAIFFFLLPQPPKPSMLSVMDGTWTPSAADISAGRTNSFATTIEIINGECGGVANAAAQNRIAYFNAFANDLLGAQNGSGAAVGDCKDMQPFDSQSSAAVATYWLADDAKSGECRLVNYYTLYNALLEGEDYDQYVSCVEESFGVTLA
ncbi:hypothetical protein HDU82_004211 [Entophlyctis luteolus]|nr:hypothetical protein HDU82_004211 [Entophlyctis luteolus]